MLAIVALDLGRGALAMDRYLSSLYSLQEYLANATDTGNKDGILATTILLYVFEVSNYRFPRMLTYVKLNAKARKESPIRCAPKYRAACKGSRRATFSTASGESHNIFLRTRCRI